MLLSRPKGGSNFVCNNEPLDNVRPTISELVSAIEEASRQKPKTRTVVKNFSRENVLRLRETQKLCKNAQSDAHVSPMKALCRPKTGIAWSSAHTKVQLPLCTSKPTQRSHFRNRQIDSSCGTVWQGTNSGKEFNGQTSLSIASCDPLHSITQAASSKNTVDRLNKQSIPKLPIDGRDCHLGNSGGNKVVQLEKKEDVLKQEQIGKSIQKQTLVRTSSAPTLATDQSSASKRSWQIPERYCYGSVPKYLVDRKKQWHEDALEKQKQKEWENSAPPGHELIPEEKRLETLHQLKDKYDELLKRMAALPVRMDTLRVCQLRKDLEKQLVNVEEAIKIFTQQKVYLKIDG